MREKPFSTEGNCCRCRRIAGARCGSAVKRGSASTSARGSADRNAFHASRAATRSIARDVRARAKQSREARRRAGGRGNRRRRTARDARRPSRRQPIENLNQVQLIVEIVLEPQHDLVDGARAVQRLVQRRDRARPDRRRSSPARRAAPGRNPPRNRARTWRSAGRVEPRRHRPLVQHVVPRHDAPGRHPQLRICGMIARPLVRCSNCVIASGRQ